MSNVFEGGLGMIERNTFLEFAPPADLSLCRAATEPAPLSSCSRHSAVAIGAGDDKIGGMENEACDVYTLLESLHGPNEQSCITKRGLPVPSPLSLEALETEDIFQSTYDCSLIHMSPPPLEYIRTNYPFRPTPQLLKVIDPLHDSPENCSPENSLLQWDAANAFAWSVGPESSTTDTEMMLMSPGYPPLLPLECLVTDDPFQPTPTARTLTWEPFATHMGTSGQMELNKMDIGAVSPRSSACDVMMPWTFEAKNTFLNVQTLEELTLQRAKTDPMPRLTDHSCEESTEVDDASVLSSQSPPTPPLLEFDPIPAQTADPFEHPSSLSIMTLQPMYVALPTIAKSAAGPPPPPMLPPPIIERCPPTRPPAMPAPVLDVPGAPQAPRAPPSHTPGSSTTALVNSELSKPGVLVRAGGGCTHVHWAVDARRLERQDKQAVSPVFMVALPEHGPTPFKIVLHATAGAIDGKRGAGFVKVEGRGRIVLKCEAQLPANFSDIAFRIGVGRDDLLQPCRGPVVQNFLEHSCHGLPASDEEWNFSAAVDGNRNFMVTLEIASKSTYLDNPSVWWAVLDSV